MNNPLMQALAIFEAAEANLVKLERLIEEAASLTGSFGPNPEYEDRSRSIDAVSAALPKIDGWKPDFTLPDSNEVAQSRFDAQEVGDPEALISVENWIDQPHRRVREYRFRFDQKRRELVRDALIELIDGIDAKVREIRQSIGEAEPNTGEQRIATGALVQSCAASALRLGL